MNWFFVIAIAMAPAEPAAPLVFGLEPVPVIVMDEYRSPMFGLIEESVIEPAPIVTPEPAIKLTELIAEPVSAPIIMGPEIIQTQQVCENGVCRIVKAPLRTVQRTVQRTTQRIQSYGSAGQTAAPPTYSGPPAVVFGSVGSGQVVSSQSFFTYQRTRTVQRSGPVRRVMQRIVRPFQPRTSSWSRQSAFQSSTASHLINDHGIPADQVASMSAWQREALHNQLHGG